MPPDKCLSILTSKNLTIFASFPEVAFLEYIEKDFLKSLSSISIDFNASIISLVFLYLL